MAFQNFTDRIMHSCCRHEDEEPSTSRVRCCDLYRVDGLLGAGFSAKVYKATCIADGAQVAIKQLRKKGRDRRSIPVEVEALVHLVGVPGVVQYCDHFSDPYYDLIVMERPKDSINLQKFIGLYGLLSEDLVRIVFKQLVEAFMQSAKRGVYHLDLNTTNMLWNLKTGELKLIDYGYAAICDDAEMNASEFGSAIHGCPPPEWHGAGHLIPSKVMVWTLGRQLYTLLTNDQSLEEDDIVYKKPKWPNTVSTGARSLAVKCLCEKPARRPTFGAVLQDRWLQKSPSLPYSIESLVTEETMLKVSKAIDECVLFKSDDSQEVRLNTYALAEEDGKLEGAGRGSSTSLKALRKKRIQPTTQI